MTEMVDLDLDVLAPDEIKVKFRGEILTMKQPSIEQYISIAKKYKKIKNLDNPEKITETELTIILKGFNDLFSEMIPELKDQPLNLNQYMKLIELVSTVVQSEVNQNLEPTPVGAEKKE